MIRSTTPVFCSKSHSCHTGNKTEGEGLPYPSLKIKKCPLSGKKGPDFVHPEAKVTIQNIVEEYLEQNISKFSAAGLLFLDFLRKCLSKGRNFLCPEKFLVVHLHIYDISNLVFVHWNFIDSIYRNLGGLVV